MYLHHIMIISTWLYLHHTCLITIVTIIQNYYMLTIVLYEKADMLALPLQKYPHFQLSIMFFYYNSLIIF